MKMKATGQYSQKILELICFRFQCVWNLWLLYLQNMGKCIQIMIASLMVKMSLLLCSHYSSSTPLTTLLRHAPPSPLNTIFLLHFRRQSHTVIITTANSSPLFLIKSCYEYLKVFPKLIINSDLCTESYHSSSILNFLQAFHVCQLHPVQHCQL